MQTFYHFHFARGKVHVEHFIAVGGACVEIIAPTSVWWEKCDITNVQVCVLIVQLLDFTCQQKVFISGLLHGRIEANGYSIKKIGGRARSAKKNYRGGGLKKLNYGGGGQNISWWPTPYF